MPTSKRGGGNSAQRILWAHQTIAGALYVFGICIVWF